MFLERIIEADNHILIIAYETKIKQLEEEKIIFAERMRQCGRRLLHFEETFLTALGFLANPHKMWATGESENQKTVLRLTFANRLSYVRNEGFQTAEMSRPFSLLQQMNEEDYEMVEGAGFEPAYAYAGGVTIRCL